jgi:hypothetical protein
VDAKNVYFLENLQNFEQWFGGQEQTSEKNIVFHRIKEILEMLEEAYGTENRQYEGGKIVFFTDEKAYQQEIDSLLHRQHINPEWNEYSEIIGEQAFDGVEWWEEMYLVSSENALVIIHPKSVQPSENQKNH